MRKADAALIDRLASPDEAEREAAAEALDGLANYYFHDHRLDEVRASHPWIAGLVAAWRDSNSPRVRLWAAQVLALVRAQTPEAAAAVASLATADGDYAADVAHYVCRHQWLLPDGIDIVRSLQHHPNDRIRMELAHQFSTTWPGVTYETDIGMLRALMRDRSNLPRGFAVMAADRFDEHTTADIDALLDVVALSSGNTRAQAKSLLAKCLSHLGLDPSTFSPRRPTLQVNGVYVAERDELDIDGVWVSYECLRFTEDGQVILFATDESHKALAMQLHAGLPARGRATALVVSDDHVEFSVEAADSAISYAGTVDGDLLTLTRCHLVSGRTEVVEYRHLSVDWDREPTPEQKLRSARHAAVEAKRQAALAKKGVPFPAPRPKSMTASMATRWYMQMTARIPQIIEDVGDHADRLAMASHLKSSMRDHAAAALVDPSLKKEFVATMALPSDQERAFPATIGEAIGLTPPRAQTQR